MSLFLHQTTTNVVSVMDKYSCICLFSYIKPQRAFNFVCLMLVVYVSFPTSNHNDGRGAADATELYMSLFLHQTTTILRWHRMSYRCICLFSYIKPQQFALRSNSRMSCICLFSYIKPQRSLYCYISYRVVYVSFPTSNHN